MKLVHGGQSGIASANARQRDDGAFRGESKDSNLTVLGAGVATGQPIAIYSASQAHGVPHDPNPATVRTGIRGTSYSALDHIIHGVITGAVVGYIAIAIFEMGVL